MTDHLQHGSNHGHGNFERRDIKTSDIVYFLIGLAVATLVVVFLIRGLYSFLDNRERAQQPAMNPLITNVPTDTLHVPKGYPQSTFPDPKLEEDERGQLNGIRIEEEQTLNSYGWVDEKAGTVRIPIDRAMDLLAQHGLPVHTQSDVTKSAGSAPEIKGKVNKK